ncbi:ABC transporter substrate-binding protein [Amnibacterium kyonggiense]|uniref:Multiple sugar transport system substrate-binding protein n=1 Tax=Amnibacterium kyonggiense TaxID=595671 RepID=A0A4R7FR51_9MICO|nr:sugar ABC transporter substrate-binding protein [Amnibacterium kyonggiense]TDS80271.1 multiple sugar transport system substrate-binding protein [Amnibacterium kyonggiense]
MTLTRRQALGAAAVGTLPLALAGCGFVPSAAPSKAAAGTIAFTTWGTDAELAGFRSVIASFEKAHPGAEVTLNAVPYEQMFTNIDAQLQAGNPPDVFRVPYYTFGSYAGGDQLLDLSKHLPSGFADRFTPQAWAAVQQGGKPFGVPHHTDTNVIFYNRKALSDAGVTSVPTSADSAWTWSEFRAVAQKLRSSLPSNRYPFAYNWQGNGVTRWLNWLFQDDGRFLSSDLKSAAIDSTQGRAAIDFTRTFFPDRLVPKNDFVKSSTYAADAFANESVAMVFSGAFAIPDTDGLKFEWGSTFSPRQARGGSDFGGNALVATKAAGGKAELIAEFFDHVTQEAQMRTFCEGASLLPTRQDLVSDGISFTVRPELSKVSVGQASLVRASDSGQVASPNMSKIITVLQTQLDTAFVGGRGAAATATAAAAGITAAVA